MFQRRRLSLRVLVLIGLVLLISTGFSTAQTIPKPEDVLGFEVGADFHLATYEQAIRYFRSLEQASPRIKLFEIGKTSMGKPMIYAVISSAENMARLDRIKEISKQLSLVGGLSDKEAKNLAAEGKPVVYIDGGLHASECAPAQQNILLAYTMVASEAPDIRFIRENTVLVLVFANPDGMDLLAEWYLSNVGTPYEVSRMPYLYHKYVGHDNNRDSYMVNMPETQNLTRIANQEWYPVILYNQHQTAPFPARIWIPPASEPTNPNAHPMLIRWQNLIGSAMGAVFDREGKSGAISRTVFDTWYPGYVTQVVDGHNIISLLTETALYRYATPHFYTLDDFPDEYQDFTTSAFYPNPWPGGWWRLRDAVDYCFTASKAVLQTAAKYPSELLYDKYRMGRDIIERFKKEPPYAWIIPKAQWDPPTAALLLDKMMLLAVDVYEADDDFVSDGIHYPAGTWVIPMSQPFGLFIKNIFEEQEYPDLIKYPHAWQGLVGMQKFPGAYLPPYDMAGWTLPHQMGVKVTAAQSPLDVGLSKLDKIVPPAAKAAAGANYAYIISPRTNNSFTAVNRILKSGGEVYRTRESETIGGKVYPPGTYLIISKSVEPALMENIAGSLNLNVGGADSRPVGEVVQVKSPRVALYKSYTASMDEGWTRWLLEQFEFPYTNIEDPEVKAGDLRERFDVLIIPSMSTNAIVKGLKKGTIAPSYVGGITENGVRNIKEFVEAGGTLVTLNNSCLFAIDKLGLPVRDTLKGLKPPGRREPKREDTKPPQFSCPGSILRMDFDVKHPVGYGMPEHAPALFSRSPAFSATASFGEDKIPVAIAKYPGGELLISGYLLGGKHLNNKSSAMDVPLGAGRVILLGFGVQSRAQPHGTFKLLFNSLYYSAYQEK